MGLPRFLPDQGLCDIELARAESQSGTRCRSRGGEKVWWERCTPADASSDDVGDIVCAPTL